MQNTVKVNNRQTCLDISIQEAGSVEAAFMLAQANEISITDDLETGSMLVKPGVLVAEVVAYYLVNGLHPASNDLTYLLDGIGYWNIGYDFIVS